MLAPIALVGLCTSALAADSRPMSEMQGDCDNYAWNMVREFNLLNVARIALPALPQQDPAARAAALDRHLDVTLKPAPEVTLLAKPGREPGADTFSGLLPLYVPRTSTYRVSSSERLWIDVIGPQGIVASTKFEMQSGCEKLRKSVAFRLDPETQYWIQLTGSPVLTPVLLITLDH